MYEGDRAAGDQVEPALAAGDGVTFAVWVDEGAGNENLWIRALLPNGMALGPSLPASNALFGTAASPHLAVTSAGPLVATLDVDAGRIGVVLFNPDLSTAAPLQQLSYVSGGSVGAGPPRVASLDGGSLAVLAWREGLQLRFNRLDLSEVTASAARLDGTSGANAGVIGTPGDPDVAATGDGGFVLAYRTLSGGQRILARRFQPGGAAIGSELVVASGFVVSAGSRARISALGSGRLVVVWSGPGAGNDDIHGQLLEVVSGGLQLVGGTFVANDLTPGPQSAPAVAARADGSRFVVAWTDCFDAGDCASSDEVAYDGSAAGVVAQVFSVDGDTIAREGRPFVLATTVGGVQGAPALAMGPDGSWAAAWQDEYGGDTDAGGVLARHFDAAGAARLPARLFQGDVSGDGVSDPRPVHALSANGSGTVTVVWEDDSSPIPDGSGRDVYLARMSPTGVRLAVGAGGETALRVNLLAPGDQVAPRLALHPSGRGAVLWAVATDPSDARLVIRPFDVHADGTVELGTQRTVPNSDVVHALQGGYAVAASAAEDWDADGRIAVAWEQRRSAGSDEADVYLQLYGADGTDLGSTLVHAPDAASSDEGPGVALSTAGETTAVWRRVGIGSSLWARRFGTDGLPTGPEVRLDDGSGVASDGRVAVTNHGAIVVWAEAAAGVFAILGRALDASGVPGAVVVLASSTDRLAGVDLAVDAEGRGVVAWQQDTEPRRVLLRRFAADLAILDLEVAVASEAAPSALFPTVALGPEGDVSLLLAAVVDLSEGGTSTAGENLDLLVVRTSAEPPVADLEASPPVCLGQEAALSAASAPALFAQVVEWDWDLDYDGVTFDIDATGPNPRVAVPNVDAVYDLLLRVADDRTPPRTGFSRGSLTTTALPGLAMASFTAATAPGRVVSFDACAACGGHGGPYRYDWDYGDGMVDSDSSIREPTHQYAASGEYTATLRVRDALGCQAASNAAVSFEVLPIIETVDAEVVGGGLVAAPGDRITFALEGDADRVAGVALNEVSGPFSSAVALTETPQGSGDYRGEYTVPPTPAAIQVLVTGQLSEASAVRLVTLQAAQTLTFAPDPPDTGDSPDGGATEDAGSDDVNLDQFDTNDTGANEEADPDDVNVDQFDTNDTGANEEADPDDAVLNTVDADDNGTTHDIGADHADPHDAAQGGCGCRTGPPRPVPYWLFIVLLWLRKWRPPSTSRPSR